MLVIAEYIVLVDLRALGECLICVSLLHTKILGLHMHAGTHALQRAFFTGAEYLNPDHYAWMTDGFSSIEPSPQPSLWFGASIFFFLLILTPHMETMKSDKQRRQVFPF